MALARDNPLSVQYRRFAADEAEGRSPLYHALAMGVAADPALLSFLADLPAEKQQPNLLFAAFRKRYGVPCGFPEFRRTLLASPETIRDTMMSHATQTNEPQRCAVLLPLLARLPQPLALIEVGASAGLCLLPDFYAYDYGASSTLPAHYSENRPVFRCTVHNMPIPDALPDIAWRAGIDLNPLDVGDPEQAGWLETLVWPEQTQRLANLRAALAIARRERPTVLPGDLLGETLRDLCARAPRGTTLIVFHTAVLSYVGDQVMRDRFASQVTTMCDYWIANESPRVYPGFAARAGTPMQGRFLMTLNGVPVAWTDPHGASIDGISGQ